MSDHPAIDEAIARAKAELERPITPEDEASGWDEPHNQAWLTSLASIERFLAGETAGPRFSIVRSLDMIQGSLSLDNARGKALLEVAKSFRENGINRYS